MIPLNSNFGIPKRYANRHGLITGATGTGKTVTMQKLCEEFSRSGVPVFVADIKGDVSGIATANPCRLLDVYGENGAKIHITLESLGVDLTARLLGLTDAQSGLIEAIMESQTVTDLEALESLIIEHGHGMTAQATLRAVKRFRRQGGDSLIGAHCYDVASLFEYENGKGVINVLDAQKLSQNPLAYSTFLIWLLTELYNRMPEAGDLEKPRLVVMLDEAHLIFTDCAPVILQSIERIIRLIRSKGVGVYFVSQLPTDIPQNILAQLGTKIQHALRGSTIQDQRAIRASAESMPINPTINAVREIGVLGIGEALFSTIGQGGVPTPCQKIKIDKPYCKLSALSDSERMAYKVDVMPAHTVAPVSFSFGNIPQSAWVFAIAVGLFIWLSA